jgi:lipoprotein-releasing system permease protein
MSFSWFVARRYLTARRRQAFISLISAVSVLGVGVGVMALIIALALMTGVQTELQDRLVGSAAHVYVQKYGGGFGPMSEEEPRLARPGVVGMAPAIVEIVLFDVGGFRAPGPTSRASSASRRGTPSGSTPPG